MGEALVVGGLAARIGPDAELRELRLSGRLVLDGIGFTVRDDNWATVSGRLVRRSVERSAPVITIREHWAFGDPGLSVRLTWQLYADRLLASYDAEVEQSRLVNRVGFVLLHPLEMAGRRAVAHGRAGAAQGSFPTAVNPHPVFSGVRALEIDVADGVRAEIDFGDDWYETEDHRNWTDAGWKSYSPPLAEPAPRRIEAGQRFHQSISIRSVVAGDLTEAEEEPPMLRVAARPVGRLPRIGFGVAPAGAPDYNDLAAGPDPIDLLGRATFLHAELAGEPVAVERLDLAANQARTAGLELWVTVALVPAEVENWVRELARHADVVRAVCPVDPRTHTSTPQLSAAVAAGLGGSGVTVGGGTRGYLAELGRSRVGYAGAQFVQLSLCPQVHHRDPERIIDTLRAQPALVRTAAATAPGRPLMVAPITLAPRMSMHTNASSSYGPWSSDWPTDPRSWQQLGAAWCVGTVAGLTGAQQLSFFDVGLGGGLVDREGVPSPAGRLLADLAEYAGAELLETLVSDQRRLAGLALRHRSRTMVMAANLTDQPLSATVAVGGREVKATLDPYGLWRLPVRSQTA